METNNKRKAWGKGLEQLLNSEQLNFETFEQEIVDNTPHGDIMEIPISEIRSNPYQPRVHFDPLALQELAESIKQHGVLEPIIVKTGFTLLSIIPATINLAGLDIELLEKGYQNAAFKKNEQLRNALEPIKDNYDFIIIDCPPSLGLLTTNALVASDSVIIPVQCEFFALEGITQLLNTIIMTQTRLNPNLKIEGVLLTLLDSRTNLGLEVVEEVRKFFKDKVFNTIIPRLIRLVEAPSHGEPINEYDPTSRAAEAYMNLAKEVIDRDGNE